MHIPNVPIPGALFIVPALFAVRLAGLMKPGLGLGPWLCAGPLLPYRYKGPSASITVVVAAAAHTRFPIADCMSDTECLLYPGGLNRSVQHRL